MSTTTTPVFISETSVHFLTDSNTYEIEKFLTPRDV